MTDTHETAVAVIRETPTTVMHPMVQMAMQGGQLDTDTLRDLMQLQREYEADEAKRAFDSAFVELKADMPAVIGHDGLVDFTSSKGRTRYSHATLGGVMRAVEEAVTRHGFALAWETDQPNGKVKVTCTLTHSRGHSKRTSLEAPVDNSGGKNAIQGVASSATYLQRYTALLLLGIATSGMEEPNSTPTAEGAAGVDKARNRKALAALRRRGRSREGAEALVGRPVDEWTAEDLGEIRRWAESMTLSEATKQAEAAETEEDLRGVYRQCRPLLEAPDVKAFDALCVGLADRLKLHDATSTNDLEGR